MAVIELCEGVKVNYIHKEEKIMILIHGLALLTENKEKAYNAFTE